MYQLTQLGHDLYRERLAAAEAQRPAQRVLALARATRRAERAERRLRRAARPGLGRLRVPPAVAAPGAVCARLAGGQDRRQPGYRRRGLISVGGTEHDADPAAQVVQVQPTHGVVLAQQPD